MKRILWIGFWILTAAIVCSAQTTFYYPHVANGVLGVNTWKTTIFLTNPGDSSSVASGTITFKQDTGGDPTNSAGAGSAWSISFTDESSNVTTGTIPFTIRGGQSKKYVSAGTGTYFGGFAIVTTTAGNVQGTAIFSQYGPSGALIAEAGVPAAAAVPRQTVFVDTIGGYNIGVAYANPGPSAASVTLSLLNAASATVVATPVVQSLGSGNHAAAFTFQMFPSAAAMSGTMQISSTVPLAAIALRFDPTFSVFTTLPPITLASLYPAAAEWLQAHPWLQPLGSVARLLGSLRFGIA
jgi:hypothetical protein